MNYPFKITRPDVPPCADKLLQCLEADEQPPLFWHYTSAQGALSIMQSATLHLGSHAFMNDPGEGEVARRLVVNCATDANLDAAGFTNRDYLGETTGQFFVCSFTAQRDSLSQWSRYGDNGAGISLGFEVNLNLLVDALGFDVDLRQVHYVNPECKRDLARQHLTKILREKGPEAEDLIKTTAKLRVAFKSHAYREELEWRIVAFTNRGYPDTFDVKTNKFGIIPFVPIPLGPSSGLELKQLVLGPKMPGANEESARWLCSKYGQKLVNHGKQTEIVPSGLAYR